ncbi:hypothetical protein PCE1_003471 [Barthelona sp. PCE]
MLLSSFKVPEPVDVSHRQRLTEYESLVDKLQARIEALELDLERSKLNEVMYSDNRAIPTLRHRQDVRNYVAEQLAEMRKELNVHRSTVETHYQKRIKAMRDDFDAELKELRDFRGIFLDIEELPAYLYEKSQTFLDESQKSSQLKGISYLKAASLLKHREALYTLGKYHYSGYKNLIKTDNNRAIFLLKISDELSCPNSPYILGKIYESMDLVEKAIEYYRKAIKRNEPNASFTLAHLLQELGRYDEAEECFTLAEQRDLITAEERKYTVYENNPYSEIILTPKEKAFVERHESNFIEEDSFETASETSDMSDESEEEEDEKESVNWLELLSAKKKVTTIDPVPLDPVPPPTEEELAELEEGREVMKTFMAKFSPPKSMLFQNDTFDEQEEPSFYVPQISTSSIQMNIDFDLEEEENDQMPEPQYVSTFIMEDVPDEDEESAMDLTDVEPQLDMFNFASM